MLARAKGRDFYDAMFLLQQTAPDYGYLASSNGIHNLEELKRAVVLSLAKVDLSVKQRDFEHLLYSKDNSRRILGFSEFIKSL
jgi:hypothetical protein